MKKREKNEAAKKRRRGIFYSYAWSTPSLLLIALMVVFPILYTGYISLTNMNVYHWFDFTIVGLDNYLRALFVFDSGFLSALLATILWTAVNMVLQLIIAFVLASLLNIQKLRLRKLYKTLLMFPWAMPGYALGCNAQEQAGLHDTLGLLLYALGVEDRELEGSPEHMITVTPAAGTDFIGFWR